MKKSKKYENKLGGMIFLTGYCCPAELYSNFSKQGVEVLDLVKDWTYPSLVKYIKARQPEILMGHSAGAGFATAMVLIEGIEIPELKLYDGHMPPGISCPFSNFEAIFGSKGESGGDLETIKKMHTAWEKKYSKEALYWCKMITILVKILGNFDNKKKPQLRKTLKRNANKNKNTKINIHASTNNKTYTYLESIEQIDDFYRIILPQYIPTTITASIYGYKCNENSPCLDNSDDKNYNYSNLKYDRCSFGTPDHFDCVANVWRDNNKKSPYLIKLPIFSEEKIIK